MVLNVTLFVRVMAGNISESVFKMTYLMREEEWLFFCCNKCICFFSFFFPS